MPSKKLNDWKSAGEFISLGPLGLKIFVRQIGKINASPDRTLLLLHGFPESSYSYHKVLEGLQTRFDRIILFDFPGFGWSDKPEGTYAYSLFEHADMALAVWERLGVLGGHLLAHDMGVSVATEILYRQEFGLTPAWFEKGLQSLTLTNGSLVIEFAKLRITQKILLSRIGRFFNRLTTYPLFRNQILSAHGNSNLSEDSIRELWEGNTHQDGHRKVYLTVRYNLERPRFEPARWHPALSQTQIPLHLCWGEQDQVAVIQMPHYLKKHVCPEAHLSILEGVGHFGQLGSPEPWLEAVVGYYKEIV